MIHGYKYQLSLVWIFHSPEVHIEDRVDMPYDGVDPFLYGWFVARTFHSIGKYIPVFTIKNPLKRRLFDVVPNGAAFSNQAFKVALPSGALQPLQLEIHVHSSS